jgi:hypothetical protein
MPVDFAIEILTCWKEFERLLANSGDPQIQTLASLAREKRRDAIKSAECVANSPVAQQHAKERGQPLKPVFAFD